MAEPFKARVSEPPRHLVLVAFFDEVAAYLPPHDRISLASVSRRTAARQTLASRRRVSSSTHATNDTAVANLHRWLVREYKNVEGASRTLQRGRSTKRQRNAAVLSAAQLRVVMRDLVLVASGVRASCLVDCCALEPAFVALLLDALASEDKKRSEWAALGCFHHVYAVMLEGNVFFVNAPRFLKAKSIDLASNLNNLLGVNVSARLNAPKVLFPNAEQDYAVRVVGLCEAMEIICDRLCALVLNDAPSRRVLQLDVPFVASTTALAGVLLCYPAIYDLFDPSTVNSSASNGNSGGSSWEFQDNCLSMRPLHVLQTFVSGVSGIVRSASPSENSSSAVATVTTMTVLQEFSIPLNVIQLKTARRPVQPTLALIKASCKVALKCALQESTFASSLSTMILPGVQVETKVLPQVAL